MPLMRNPTVRSTTALGALMLLCFLIYWIGYCTPRTNFHLFIGAYFLSVALFYFLWRNAQRWHFNHFLAIAIAMRLLLLWAVPELSDDFYRFIWDGELIHLGVNPYSYTPRELITQVPVHNSPYMQALYRGMSTLSQTNYSCYPVFNQLLFAIPTGLFDTVQSNLIGFKVLLSLADIGVMLIGKRLLERMGKSAKAIGLYALHPFIVLEFSGNLHFEGVMIFFMLLSSEFILRNKPIVGGILWGFAIHVKLIPLLLIPFFYKLLKWRRSLVLTVATGATVIVLGALMLDEVRLGHLLQSVDLYFDRFEFNASIFYVLRAYSLSTVGYDEIGFYGVVLFRLAVGGIVALALLKAIRQPKHLFSAMLFALTIHYLMATTVHPWYISLILLFSVFTSYRFGLLWSVLVMLSYGAYANPGFEENGWHIGLEYGAVIALMVYEIFRNTKREDIDWQLKHFFQVGKKGK